MNDIFEKQSPGRRRGRMVERADRRRVHHTRMDPLPGCDGGPACVVVVDVGTGDGLGLGREGVVLGHRVPQFVLWLMTLAVVWLTLWARQLRKRAGSP